MSNYSNKKTNLKIYPLTPIHIGSGESIVPGEYMLGLSKDKDGNYYYNIYVADMASVAIKCCMGEQLAKWLENTTTWLIEVNKYDELKKTFRENIDYRILAANKEIYEEIKQKFFERKAELAINSMTRNINGIYIPGSSIKGAIRTGVLFNKLKIPIDVEEIKKSCKNSFKLDYSEYERKLLRNDFNIFGSVSDDIFKNIKVSDTSTQKMSSCLYRTNFVGMASLPDFRETTRFSFDKSVSLDFSINIVNDEFDLSNILSSMDKFYKEVLEEEKLYWEDNAELGKSVLNVYNKIEELLNKDKDVYLIRVGWGVGLDSMSFNIAKSDPPNGKQNPYKKKIDEMYYADIKTRKLFDDKYPLGWAVIKKS